MDPVRLKIKMDFQLESRLPWLFPGTFFGSYKCAKIFDTILVRPYLLSYTMFCSWHLIRSQTAPRGVRFFTSIFCVLTTVSLLPMLRYPCHIAFSTSCRIRNVGTIDLPTPFAFEINLIIVSGSMVATLCMSPYSILYNSAVSFLCLSGRLLVFRYRPKLEVVT